MGIRNQLMYLFLFLVQNVKDLLYKQKDSHHIKPKCKAGVKHSNKTCVR